MTVVNTGGIEGIDPKLLAGVSGGETVDTSETVDTGVVTSPIADKVETSQTETGYVPGSVDDPTEAGNAARWEAARLEQERVDGTVDDPTAAGDQARWDAAAKAEIEEAGVTPLPNKGQTDFGDYIDPNKSTVQGQVKGLLEDPSSPLMLQAKTQALQGAQGAGLKNTTLAQTAGMDALYKTAMGMAVPDSQTYAAMDQLDADYDFKRDFWAWQNKFDTMALEKNLAADERQMMTSSFSGMFNSVITDVTRIMSDPDMDAGSKRAMVNELWTNYQDSVTTFSDLNNYDYEW